MREQLLRLYFPYAGFELMRSGRGQRLQTVPAPTVNYNNVRM